jgi:hypothetical protein
VPRPAWRGPQHTPTACKNPHHRNRSIAYERCVDRDRPAAVNSRKKHRDRHDSGAVRVEQTVRLPLVIDRDQPTEATTAVAVPLIIDAPGAVLATSNRADVWATTHTTRARAGTVWVFDPQAITRTGQHWWWNPLAAVQSVEDAARMASHFVQPTRRDKGEDAIPHSPAPYPDVRQNPHAVLPH